MPNSIIALFLIAHGIVHPILAVVPGPDSETAQMGTLWNQSWLLGDGSATKTLIYIGAAASCLLLVLSGLSLMDWLVPQDWWRTLTLAGAALSLLVLVVFWNNYFPVGVIIDLALLALLLFANWDPITTTS